MAQNKRRPARVAEVRIGHTYYMPVPARQLCVTQTETCTCLQAGLMPGQGCSNKPGGCLMLRILNRQDEDTAKTLIRDGVLLYRSKGKAKVQGRRGRWLRPLAERQRFWAPPKNRSRDEFRTPA